MFVAHQSVHHPSRVGTLHAHTGGPCCPDTAWDLLQYASSHWQLNGHLCHPLPSHCTALARNLPWFCPQAEVETTGKWRPLMKTLPRSSLSLTSCSCSHLKPLHHTLHRVKLDNWQKACTALAHPSTDSPGQTFRFHECDLPALPNPGSRQPWGGSWRGIKQSGDLPSLHCPGSSCAGAGSGTQSSRQRCCPRAETYPG